MPSFEVALAWIIISPIAFLTNCLGVSIILHYQPLYHSCDVAFLSLFITMATNSLLLLPIPAVVKLGNFYWSKDLCSFYTWLSITLRSSHLMVLLIVNVYWMASLRLSTKKRLFTSATPMKLSICTCWFAALLAGIIPAGDTIQIFNYYSDNSCRFLPMSISRGFGIFFIIISLLSAVMGVISSLDTFLIFRSMKDVASTKYGADRFHVPTISGSLRPGSLIHAKYNELNVSLELCRLVLWFSIGSSVVNGIPLMASQFVQLIQDYNRETMETTLLWLLLIESLTLPHLLWVLSRRYRHAVVYTWRVFVLRDISSREEDTAACTLQNFRLNVKAVTYRPHRNGNLSLQANGHVNGIVTEDVTTDVDDRTSMPRANGHVRDGHSDGRFHGARESAEVVADIEDGLTVVTTHVISSVIVGCENSPEVTIHSPKKIHGHNIITQKTSFTPEGEREIENIQILQTHTGTTPSSSGTDNNPNISQISTCSNKSTLLTLKAEDVKRSTSASCRQEWKDIMMKKHLPGVFLDNSFNKKQNNLLINTNLSQLDGMTSEKMKGHETGVPVSDAGYEIYNQSVNHRTNTDNRTINGYHTSDESSYNMSGDYDYDYINDTLVRILPQTNVKLKKNYRNYEDADIDHVLGVSASSNESRTNTITPEASKTGLSPILRNNQRVLYQNERQPEAITSHSITSLNSSASIRHYLENHSDKHHESVLINVQNNGTDGNSPQNVPRRDPDDVIISFGNPIILRSNYRKFLPYTDLVISNVDDVSEDDSNEDNVANDQENTDDLKSKSNDINTSSVDVASLRKQQVLNLAKPATRKEQVYNLSTPTSLIAPLTASLLKEQAASKPITTTLPQKEPQAVSTKPPRETETADRASDNYLQDYSQLETISGSEMLRLKMKSLRSATAIYHSDDTTSEEGGIDNNGFDDNSEDESKVSRHNVEAPAVEGNQVGQKLPDFKLRSLGSGRSSPSPSTKGLKIDESTEYTPERNYSGDGEESELNSVTHDKSLAGFINDSFRDAPERLPANHSIDAVNLDTIYNDLLIVKHIQKNKIEFTTHPLKQLNRNSEQHVHISSKEHAPNNSNISTSNYFNTNASSTNCLASSYPLQQKPQQHFQITHADSVTVQRINVDSASSVSPTRTRRSAAPIVKPPRQRRQSQDSLTEMLPSLEDDSQSARDAICSINSHNSYSNFCDSMDSKLEEDYIQSSEVSSLSDTESNISGDSVTLEPYGQRRPFWMNDSLLSSTYSPNNSIPDHRDNKQIPDIFRTEEVSTNFISSFGHNGRNDTVEYKFDIGEVNHNSNIETENMIPFSRARRYHDPLVQYNFDDDSDPDYDNSLTGDYTDNSNYHRSRNLCFESIKEEPEDCLSDCASTLERSDSASTLDQSDAFTANVFRSPTPQQRDTTISPLQLSHPPTQANKSSPTQDTHIIQNNIGIVENRKTSLPTSERTSADGSEEILQASITNSNPGTHYLSPSHPTTTTSIKRQPESKQATHLETDRAVLKTNNTSALPVYTNANIERILPLETNLQDHFKTKDYKSSFHHETKEINTQSSESGNSRFKVENRKKSVNDVSRTASLLQSVDATKTGVLAANITSAYF